MYYWRRTLAESGWIGSKRFRFTIEARCPQGPACASTEWLRPEILGARRIETVADRGRFLVTAEIEQAGRLGTISASEVRDAWRSVIAQYRFHYTYPKLAGSVTATRRRKVGDCVSLSRILAEQLLGLGFQARVSHGYIWSGVAARPHGWVEVVDEDENWKALDISMATLAADFFTPDYANFCFGSLLNRIIRVSDGRSAFVHSCGDDVLEVHSHMDVDFQ
jgi:hypothetical protein